MLKGLVTAIRTLTALPIPGKDADNLASALPWFPLVGLLLGSIPYAAALGLGLVPGMWPDCIAILLVAGGVLLTRALHLDGLADCADGFGGGGRDKQKILAIMKDPHTGAFGVLALILVLLVKWIVLSRLFVLDAMLWLVSAYVVSRTMQVLLAATLPHARATEGKASPFVNGAKKWHAFTAVVSALVILFIINGPAGLVLFAGGGVTAIVFGWWCKKKVNGITGDLLGTGSEIVETMIILLCAIFNTSLIALR